MTELHRPAYEGYLKAEDLPARTLVPVTIEKVTAAGAEKDAAGRAVTRPILHFAGKKKGLVLGKTSESVLKMWLSLNPAEWVGKTIHIQRRVLDAKRTLSKTRELCIRVIPPVGTPLRKGVIDFMGSAEATTQGEPDETDAGNG